MTAFANLFTQFLANRGRGSSTLASAFAQGQAAGQREKEFAAIQDLQRARLEQQKALDAAMVKQRQAAANLSNTRAQFAGQRDPEGETIRALRELGVNTADRMSIAQAMRSPEFRQQVGAKIQQNRISDREFRLQERKAGRTTINNNVSAGRQDLTSGVKSGQQTALINDQLQLEIVKEIDALGPSEEFLTFGAEIKDAVLSKGFKVAGSDFNDVIEFFGGDSGKARQFIEEKRELGENVQALFNVAKVDITGAAASQREIEDLKKQLINTSLDPVAFDASKRKLKRVLERNIRIRQELLAQGIDLGTSEGASKFDLAVIQARRQERGGGGKKASRTKPVEQMSLEEIERELAE